MTTLSSEAQSTVGRATARLLGARLALQRHACEQLLGGSDGLAACGNECVPCFGPIARTVHPAGHPHGTGALLNRLTASSGSTESRRTLPESSPAQPRGTPCDTLRSPRPIPYRCRSICRLGAIGTHRVALRSSVDCHARQGCPFGLARNLFRLVPALEAPQMARALTIASDPWILATAGCISATSLSVREGRRYVRCFMQPQ